jgi:predicted amidohydrolase
MRVVAIQFKGYRQDFEASQNHLYDLIELALNNNADLVVTPEMACSQYLFDCSAHAKPFAVCQDSTWICRLKHLSQLYRSTLVIGVIEIDHIEQLLYNSAAIIDIEGQCNFYRKRLLFDADQTWAQKGQLSYPIPECYRAQLIQTQMTKNNIKSATSSIGVPIQPNDSTTHINYIQNSDREHETFTHIVSSTDYPLFEVAGYRCSVGICMDLNDDHFIQFCEQFKVELLAFPTNWLDEGHSVYEYWAYRLQKCSLVLVAANTYGTELWKDYPEDIQNVNFRGESAIINLQQSTILALAEAEGDDLIFTDLPEIDVKNRKAH